MFSLFWCVELFCTQLGAGFEHPASPAHTNLCLTEYAESKDLETCCRFMAKRSLYLRLACFANEIIILPLLGKTKQRQDRTTENLSHSHRKKSKGKLKPQINNPKNSVSNALCKSAQKLPLLWHSTLGPAAAPTTFYMKMSRFGPLQTQGFSTTSPSAAEESSLRGHTASVHVIFVLSPLYMINIMMI